MKDLEKAEVVLEAAWDAWHYSETWDAWEVVEAAIEAVTAAKAAQEKSE